MDMAVSFVWRRTQRAARHPDHDEAASPAEMPAPYDVDA